MESTESIADLIYHHCLAADPWRPRRRLQSTPTVAIQHLLSPSIFQPGPGPIGTGHRSLSRRRSGQKCTFRYTLSQPHTNHTQTFYPAIPLHKSRPYHYLIPTIQIHHNPTVSAHTYHLISPSTPLLITQPSSSFKPIQSLPSTTMKTITLTHQTTLSYAAASWPHWPFPTA
jgi:hypothetical protein